MGWIAADLVYCAYPLFLTMKEGKFGMLNARADRNSEGTKRAIAKYEERGFELAPTSIEWLPHHCGESAYCPHTIRNVMDRDGFVFRLQPNMSDDDITGALCPYVMLSLLALHLLKPCPGWAKPCPGGSVDPLATNPV